MKSDRRHELQQNELADWLGQHLEMLKPHGTSILLGLVTAAVVVLGGMWYFSGESSAAAQSWSSYFGAFNQREPGKALEQLVKDKPGTQTALWAQQAIGDMNLAQGAAMLFSDRAEAQKMLQKAQDTYKLVEAAAGDPGLKARAQFGMAKVLESLCKPEEAAKYYQLAADTQKDTAIGKAAAADAQRMKDDRQVALLAWFASQTPKKPAPIPGVGGSTPGLPSDLPERPDIGLPSGLGLGNLGAGTPASPPPAFPPPADTPPAEPKAAEPKAAEPKSGEPKATDPNAAKPDAPKATDEKPADAKSEVKPDDTKPGS
jgi:hypothetical protein